MPKGYVIVRITVTDPEVYKDYVAMASAAIKQYGGKPIARGGRYEPLEGEARPRNVILEFESYDAARTYYYSPEYQAAVKTRKDAAESKVVIGEGDG